MRLPGSIFRTQRSSPRRPILLIVLIVFLFANVVNNISSGVNQRTRKNDCEKGLLTSIDYCIAENAGWWYTDAHGSISKETCEVISLGAEMLKFPSSVPGYTEQVMKTDCNALGLSNDHFCYSEQHMTADGKARFLTALITNSHCDDARYFRGSRTQLINGLPQEAKEWKEPYKGVPPIK